MPKKLGKKLFCCIIASAWSRIEDSRKNTEPNMYEEVVKKINEQQSQELKRCFQTVKEKIDLFSPV
jgi:hypothetical protein